MVMKGSILHNNNGLGCMQKNKRDTIIIDTAKKLAANEKYFKVAIEKGIEENSIKKILSCVFEAAALEEELKLLLAEYEPTTLNIQDVEISEIFRLMEDGERLKSIDGYHKVNKLLQKESCQDEKNFKANSSDFFENNFDELLQYFHKNYDILSYYRRKLTIGPLILTKSAVPEDIKAMFLELKEAYAYNLEKACFALCRMIIEKGFNDVLESQKKYKIALEINQKAYKKNNWSFGLDSNLNLAKYLKLISNDQYQKTNNIKNIGNSIIHSRNTANEAKSGIISIIKDTKNVIENLYS